MSSQGGRGSVNKRIWVVCSGKIGSSYFPSGPCFLVEKKGNSSSSPAMFQDVSWWYQFFQCLTFNAKKQDIQQKWSSPSFLVDLQEEQKKRHMLLLLFGAQPWSYCSFARHSVGKIAIYCPSAHHDQHSPKWHLSMQRNSNNLTCNFGCQNMSLDPLFMEATTQLMSRWSITQWSPGMLNMVSHRIQVCTVPTLYPPKLPSFVAKYTIHWASGYCSTPVKSM